MTLTDLLFKLFIWEVTYFMISYVLLPFGLVLSERGWILGGILGELTFPFVSKRLVQWFQLSSGGSR